jgi:acetyltransferase-like isoleucine patch superfamily enzyme
MIKRLIKFVCHKIYTIGKFEDLRINGESRKKYLDQIAEIEESAIISPESGIYNSQKNKSSIRIGKKTYIMGDLLVFKHGGRISIGSYCFVGPQTRIWSAKNITIGDRVLISHNVNIHDNISHPLDSKERHLDFARYLEHGLADSIDLKEADVIIEDDVWLGFNCVILKGVTIGRGAIIGANTLISKDVPAYAVVVGNPSTIIKYAS